MRKIYLFFAALVCATTAWADCSSSSLVDTIPVERYLTDFSLTRNVAGGLPNILIWTDNYANDQTLNRHYTIAALPRHQTDLNEGCKFSYYPWQHLGYYGYYYSGYNGYSNLGFAIGRVFDSSLSTGGYMYSNVSAIVAECYARGIRDIIFFVHPFYYQKSPGGDDLYYSYYPNNSEWNYDMINYYTCKLPCIAKNMLIAPSEVQFGKSITLEGTIQAVGKTSYKIQEKNGDSWQTLKSGTISTVDAREGQTVKYSKVFTATGYEATRQYRLIACDVESGEADTTLREITFKYKWDADGQVSYYSAGEIIKCQKPEDCKSYRISSQMPITSKTVGDYIEYTMPACNVIIDKVTPTYTVTYLNADYSWLDKVEVECGDDATNLGPTKPEYGDYTFIGWNKDLTNVHSNMTVVAKYDIGSNYWLSAAVTDHKNEVFPFEGFANSETRAMVGDKMTFTADVFATSNATLYYETAQWLAAEQRFNWQQNGGFKVADYTDANKERWFEQEISICYDVNTSYIHPFEYKVGVRFFLVIAGVKVYSEPIEIDVYYPLTINSNTGDAVFAENNFGDFTQELSTLFPARYNDTVRVISINGAEGGCLDFERQDKPQNGLFSGEDENGKAYFICPGEKEAINVSVHNVTVVFEVTGQGKPEFASLGHNVYYAEEVNCGGSVIVPEDPEEANAVFLGWKSWNDSDYPDDAYLHVPAGFSQIGFNAEFEYLPEVDTFDVKFFGKDSIGQIGATQRIAEGENAVPPTAPEIPGYHFVGWNKPYTTITANTEIVALYGDSTKTWTITYKNWDNSPLGTEEVNDGEAAQGVVATREGYAFTGWSEDISHVTSDMTVTAQFEKATYVITYTLDGEAIFSEEVEHGEMPTQYAAIEAQGKPSTEQYTYTFHHWDPEIVAATADATYEAVFATFPRTYLVRFQNWDHQLLKEQPVAYGTAAEAPANPTREGYTFKGWDRDFCDVRADLTVTAVFEKGNGEQGIEDIIAPADQAAKVLIDGALYIATPEGRIFNAQGIRVK